MFKKKALVVLVSALALTNVAQALGLGDIELNSNLNEPLDAHIDLRQLRGLTAGEILPTLASNDAFQRAGVERSFFLSNIQFDVTEAENGDMVISLSTRQPVREPFLNFLVEVNWPGGRLLKEYTLLLDPPVFDTGTGGDNLTIDSATGSADEASELTTTTRASGAETATEATPAAAVQPRQEDLPPGEYRVQRNDTLWEIANNVPAGDGYSTQQVMLAIQDLNPGAFLNNNINRLKAGSLLNLPSEAQISARTFQQAVNEVRMQNEGMAPRLRPVAEEQGATEVQLSATEETSSALPEGEGVRDPDGYLEVAPDQQSEGASAGGEPEASAEIERLQNELTVAAELNDQFERENEELESRLNQLEEQIAIMQRLLSVQGGDAAALQQQLANQEAAANERTAGETAGQEAATPTNEPGGVPSTSTTSAEESATGEAARQPTGPDSTAATDDSNESQQAQSAPTAQQPPASQPAADRGFMGFVRDFTAPASNWVLASVTNMIITGAGLLILLLLPSFIRSRMNKADEDEGEADFATAAVAGEPAFDTDFDDDLLGGFDDEAPLSDHDVADDERTSDAIMEAEMYMAYQKYEQAEEKLKSAFAEEPGRSDIGLKLLEVYAETGNEQAFDDLEQRLSLTGEQKNQVRELRERMPVALGSSDDDYSMDLDDDMDLDFGDEQSEDDKTRNGTSTSLGELEQDLKTDAGHYDLGDFESASFDTAETQSRTQSKAAQADTDDLDFSLDLDDLELPETNTESDSDADTGLDFDMGDLNLDKTSKRSEAKSATDTAEESGLDFTLDEDDLGEFDSELDFSFDETEKPSEPELPTLEAEDEGEFDFTSLDDTPAQRAQADELPTDDSLTSADSPADEPAEQEDTLDFDMESESPMEETVEAPAEAKAELEEADLRDLADALPGGADLDDDEFDFLSGSDEASTKLDLARAYIEMDDREGARDILEEVVSEGTEDQRQQAKALMDKI